ncbi:hypothetical protein C1646_751411 [Rhizophagus diaphanus]|nr:hypothetical protein C1646_751411 [Rhizophagus diaphanus] [Rhizophagus sp. MUCL 43196]
MSNHFRENVLPCKTNSPTLFMADDDFEMLNIDAALLETLCNVCNYADAKNRDEIVSFVERDFTMSSIESLCVKNLNLTSVDQVENTVLPEHDSDVVLHSLSSFYVTENSEIANNGECCSVDSSKLEYTGYLEKISNLTNNDVQVSPSPTIRLLAREIITKYEMIMNGNTVYSYPKYKLPPSIVCVNSPLINSPSSVFTNENQSMILCIEPPGNPSSCDTSCDTIVTSLRDSSQTCSQTDSTNSLLFEDALYTKGKKTEVVPMFVDTHVHRENEESSVYYEITKAVLVSSVNLCGHKGNEIISPYYETMRTVLP